MSFGAVARALRKLAGHHEQAGQIQLAGDLRQVAREIDPPKPADQKAQPKPGASKPS